MPGGKKSVDSPRHPLERIRRESGVVDKTPARQLMSRALEILDASDEALAAVYLEHAIQSIRRS